MGVRREEDGEKKGETKGVRRRHRDVCRRDREERNAQHSS